MVQSLATRNAHDTMKPKERSLSWTRTLSVLVTLALVSLALILLSQGRQLQPLESAVGGLFSPIQRAVHDATAGVGDWISSFGRSHDLEQRVLQLTQERDAAIAANATLQNYQRDNDQLRAMLKFQDSRPQTQAVVAHNIGGDPSGLSETVTIDKGTKDGIAVGMAVTSPSGILVGQVSAARLDRATVLLITDIDSHVAIATQRTQTPGVLEGRWQKGGRMLMTHIPRDNDVKNGDLVLTTGVGGILPKGLIVGQVNGVRQSDVQMEKEAEVYPLIDPNSVEGVLVITSK